MIELDGSHGEGGGQILRTSLALSLITGKPFHMRKVRAGRAKPGLQPQHRMSVQAAAEVGQARVQGATLHSTDLRFHPGQIRPGNYHFSIGTAGATGLVLHTVYLPLALSAARNTLTLEGGTHVNASPCFHFLDTTWRAYLALLDIDVQLRMVRPGFYPRGGGAIEVTIAPCQAIKPLELLDLATPTEARGFSAVAGLPEHVARRQRAQALHCLEKLGLAATIHEEAWAGGPGSVLALCLQTAPVPTLFFGLGARGKPAERVADDAVAQVGAFLHSRPTAIDPYSGDQLLLPLSLAAGSSRFRVAEVTMHLLTNAQVIAKFVDRRIEIEGDEGKPGVVKVA
jgi:RNA 3'-phosphate cyclase